MHKTIYIIILIFLNNIAFAQSTAETFDCSMVKDGDQRVTQTLKSSNSKVMALCNSSQGWGPIPVQEIAKELSNRKSGDTGITYYTNEGGFCAKVIPDKANPNDFVTTTPDDTTLNNLKCLPECNSSSAKINHRADDCEDPSTTP